MRILRTIIFLTLLAVVGMQLLPSDTSDLLEVKRPEVMDKTTTVASKATTDSKTDKIPFEGELYHLIGKQAEQLLEELGEPVRKDLSAYEHEWWIYPSQGESYLQFGIEDNEIKTIYGIGEGIGIEPIQVGQAYDEIVAVFPIAEEVEYLDGVSSYKFKLTEEDLASRPLVKLTDDLFLQIYFDTFTNELSSVRLIQADVLLRMRPYEIVYRGPLPDEPNLEESEWKHVQAGMEQQIFDMTNVLRGRFDKSQLKWESDLSQVAFLHSKDMSDKQYFSHYSEDGNGLKERLAASDLFYIAAGENIAAQYPDAASAVEGWLNSEGHRKALLAEEYTHLGVGVYRLYYTQNFLVKPM